MLVTVQNHSYEVEACHYLCDKDLYRPLQHLHLMELSPLLVMSSLLVVKVHTQFPPLAAWSHQMITKVCKQFTIQGRALQKTLCPLAERGIIHVILYCGRCFIFMQRRPPWSSGMSVPSQVACLSYGTIWSDLI